MTEEQAGEPTPDLPGVIVVVPGTGADRLEALKTPHWLEIRNETVLTLAESVGYEEARRIGDRLWTKRIEVLTVFTDDLLSPETQMHLEAVMRGWLIDAEDWDKLQEAEADRQAATATARGEFQYPAAVIHDTSDGEAIPLEARQGMFLAEASMEASMSGADGPSTTFTYRRYRLGGA